MNLKNGKKFLCLLGVMVSIMGCNIQEQDIEDAAGDSEKVVTKNIIQPPAPTPLTIIPSFKRMFIGSEFQFSAQGGKPPYSYSMVSGPGAMAADGKYLAPGSQGNAIVQVRDNEGTTKEAPVTIDEELVVTPTTKKMNISTSFQFSVSGGNPPYYYSVVSGGGSISDIGVFSAPPTPGESVIQVTDNFGTVFTPNPTITIGNGPIIAPTTSKMPINSTKMFTLTSGTGPFTWEVVTVGGGTFDGGLATFTTPNAFATFTSPTVIGNSIIRVTDNLGFSSEATVESFKLNKIALSNHSTCVLKGSTNEIKCWGQNENGHLGNGGMIVGDDPSDMGDNIRPVILATGSGYPVSTSVGTYHACAVLNDGMAQCWGYAVYGLDGATWWGARGTGETNSANTMGDNIGFVPMGLDRTIKQMASNYYHNCALMDDDNVKCWGASWYGELGQDNGAYVYSNVLYSLPNVDLGQTAQKVAVGQIHSCALLTDGSVKCWGYNDYGMLGQDNTTQVGIAAGQMAALAPVNLGGSTAIDIAANSRYRTCVILSNGKVRCWGYNGYGDLGQGHTTNKGGSAGDMASLTDISFGAGRSAVKITMGMFHNCVLLDNATIKCWGYNGNGQLGYGDTVNRGGAPGQMSTLTAVSLGTDRTVVDVSASAYSTCAILDNQTMKCWGYNNEGQLGLGHVTNVGTQPEHMGDNLPTVNLGTGVIPLKLATNNGSDGDNCVVVLKDGNNKLLCWGRGLYGQHGNMMGSIGIRTSDMGPGLASVNLGTSNGQVKDITRNYAGYCATMNDDTSKCWGYNYTGYRLTGSNSAEENIGDISKEMGTGLGFLNAGIGVKTVKVEGATGVWGPTVCGLFDDQSLKCWGYNGYGQLGQDNTANYSYLPTTPPINLGVGRYATQFSVATYFSTCALLDNGTVKCWGYNGYGNLGLGNTTNIGGNLGDMAALLPVDLGTGRTAKYVAASHIHVCVILDNDKVKCWGYNANGELGQNHANNIGDGPGEMGDNLPYTDLGTGRTAKKLSCGVNYCCAILDNDKLKCWGYNGYGNLGLGNTSARGNYGGSMGDLLPYVNVGTGRTVVDVQTSYYHTCAVLDNNDVKCWGWNHRGQLGLGKSDWVGNDPGEMGDLLPPINF